MVGVPSKKYLLTRPPPQNQTNAKQSRRVKNLLDDSYSYLGGNAFARDKKGRVRKDDPTDFEHLAGEAGGEYTAFVYFELDVE